MKILYLKKVIKIFKNILNQLKFCFKLGKKATIINIIFGIISNIIPIISIIFSKYLIDIIFSGQNIEKLFYYTLIFVSLMFFLNIFERYLMNLANTQNNIFSKNCIIKENELLSSVDYEVLEQDRFLKKIYLARQFKQKVSFTDIGTVIGNFFALISIIAIISTLNIWLVLFLFSMIALNTYIKDKFIKKDYEINKSMEKILRRNTYLKKVLNEKEYGKEIRINNLSKHFINEFEENRKEILKKNNKKRIFSNLATPQFTSFTDFLQNFLVYSYITVNVLVGSITLGSFTMYIQAISKFSGIFLELMECLVEFKNANLYFEDFEELYKLPREMQKGKKIVENTKDSHCIEFKNVSFKYPNNETYILKNINIKINKGEKLAIVGENGAGKTTFIKLLIRLYDVTEGEILLDGVNIKEIDYKSYMNTLSVVFQDFKLFYESIKENVALSKIDEATDEEILEVLEKSGLKENINKFKKGIHTTVYKEFDDEGVELSGGEGQKLCLARALYKNGGIVILDEPTSALDPRSEYDLYMKFNELVENKTSIYISHRLSSTRFCDNIAVFEDGEIVEYGTHNDLIKKNGIYNELYSKQAEFYK